MVKSPFQSLCRNVGNSSFHSKFAPFARKMEANDLSPIAINTFKYFFDLFLSGNWGKLSEQEIDPVKKEEIYHYDRILPHAKIGKSKLNQVVIMKLNGGLGTSMGLDRPKSLLPVKDGFSFLEIILRQTECLRRKFRASLPLVFMNSFATHADTMAALGGFTNGDTGIPVTFAQDRFPKILQRDGTPAVWPKNPSLEWNPPGHGDIYTALVTSNLLENLLASGYRYAFVSNSDNLGAILDERILGLMVSEKLPFLMEVAERTTLDRKGGHLCWMKDGRLSLREASQCPKDDMDHFFDTDRHGFFNTNSIWLDLKAVEEVFIRHRMMPLDLIVNPKRLDPRNPQSPAVYQLESAMGSAISAFPKASAVCVPRRRFSPVKNCNDLFLVMSDCYVLTKDFSVMLNPRRKLPLPEMHLDPQFFGKYEDFLTHFPVDVPSLRHCTSLFLEGDAMFAKDALLKGEVALRNSTDHRLVVTGGLLRTFGNDFSVLNVPRRQRRSVAKQRDHSRSNPQAVVA